VRTVIFLSFYSKTKGVLYKLNKGNLIANKEDLFLKDYFLMAIETTELQMEVKGFLRDTNATYLGTLELIHMDFRVFTTGEHLRETATHSGSTAIVRRGKRLTKSILRRLAHRLKQLDYSPTITASSYIRITTESLGSGTKRSPG